jgi:hypothetical protein
MTDPIDTDEVRGQHVLNELHDPPCGACLACDQPHPCDAIRLADALDEAREMVERLTFFQIQNKELREAGALLGKAFDLGIFVRSTKGDSESNWAIKLMPYLRAVAVLVEDVSESESTKNQEENDG